MQWTGDDDDRPTAGLFRSGHGMQVSEPDIAGPQRLTHASPSPSPAVWSHSAGWQDHLSTTRASVTARAWTVVAPHSVSPGYGSPGAAVAGWLAALSSRHYAGSCAYVEPSVQAACRTQISQVPASQMPSVSDAALGYIAIDGSQAAAGMTGKFCVPGQSPECFTNNDPAAIFATAKSFSALWANAIKPSLSYSLTPCTEIGGKWYIYSSS